MRSRIHTLILAGLPGLVCIAFVGCAEEGENAGFSERIIDSVALAINSVPAEVLPGTTVEVGLTKVAPKSRGVAPVVSDLLVEHNTVYAVHEGGLLIHDVKTGESRRAFAEAPLSTLVKHSGEVYLGGERLYRVDSTELVAVEAPLDGAITALASYGPTLLIGTDCGLYAHNILGTLPLLEDMTVTHIVADNGGFWIGTQGQGLYRWDGQEYKKRYLTRDPSLFDTVTALSFGHNHLYVGTPHGMYVYDGGSWKTIDESAGLPSGYVTDIDASDWTVYVGTTDGLVTLHDGVIAPVQKFESQVIASVARQGLRLVVSTVEDGVVLKNGPTVKTLVEPWQDDSQKLASVLH